MKSLTLAALLALTPAMLQAATSKDLESSAIVEGNIVLNADGSVLSAEVPDEDKYGKPIADLVRKAALQWRFKPVVRNGEPVRAKASMHVRVVLKKAADGNYVARIKGASFGDNDMKDTDILRGNAQTPPRYPQEAIRARVEGTVYLSLHVDREGHVTDVVAEQVNLASNGSEHLFKHFRNVLAQASISAARHWTYLPPTTGELAAENEWIARVPVHYNLFPLGSEHTEIVWRTYAPGPYTPAPWVDRPDADAADTLAGDEPQTQGAGPVLLSGIKQG